MFNKKDIIAICYLVAFLIVPSFPTGFSPVCSLVAEKSAGWCLIKKAEMPVFPSYHFSQPRESKWLKLSQLNTLNLQQVMQREQDGNTFLLPEAGASSDSSRDQARPAAGFPVL